jgi:hypothetical protein
VRKISGFVDVDRHEATRTIHMTLQFLPLVVYFSFLRVDCTQIAKATFYNTVLNNCRHNGFPHHGNTTHGLLDTPFPELLLESFCSFLGRRTQGTFSMHFLTHKHVLSHAHFHSSSTPHVVTSTLMHLSELLTHTGSTLSCAQSMTGNNILHTAL